MGRRRFQIRNDSSVTDSGFQSAKLESLAPVGDGRVYVRKDGELHVLETANQLSNVLDENGLVIDVQLDQLIYEPATNSLIGVSSDASVPCAAFKHITAHRLDLAADGLSVIGPMMCSSFDFMGATKPIGLDRLPNGSLLVTCAGGSIFSGAQMLELDPATLAFSPWAAPDEVDLDGGVWCPELGATVVLDDKLNELRIFAPGQSGPGTPLPTTVPMGDIWSGVSADNKITNVALLGPGCGGLAKAFGTGTAAPGGEAPSLGAGSCPAVGTTLPIIISNAIGGGFAFVTLGTNSQPIPLFGSTLHVSLPFLLVLSTPLGGPGGAAGMGFGQVNLPIPADPVLLGLRLFGQAFVLDAGAPEGIVLTQGLGLWIG